MANSKPNGKKVSSRVPQITTGVYFIICTPTQRVYIGSSKDVIARFKSHRWALRKGVHWNKFLLRAFKKYGVQAFSFEVKEECPEGKLIEREQYFLDSFPEPKKLFNLSRRAYCPESTPRVCSIRSVNAKRQHAEGKLGRATWKDPVKNQAKLSAAVSKNAWKRKGIVPNFEWTPERKARVAKAMRKRRAAEKAAGNGATCEWNEKQRKAASKAAKERWEREKAKGKKTPWQPNWKPDDK